MVLADLTNTVKLDTGAVRKIYTLEGTPVNSLVDLKDEEVFIAYGVDKCHPDDFDLDLIEFRNVQAILKSQKLDLKYEKFAHMSPKTSRNKFLLSRTARKSRGSSKSRASNGLKNGHSFHNIEDLSDSYPSEVTDKYHIRQVFFFFIINIRIYSRTGKTGKSGIEERYISCIRLFQFSDQWCM